MQTQISSSPSNGPEKNPQGVFSPIIRRHINLTRERLEGAAFGIMLGDALGLPVETWDEAKILSRFGLVFKFLPLHHNPFYKDTTLPPGTWSDDTQLSAAMFNAFADARGYWLEAIIARHIEAFKESTLGWGSSTIAGVRALERGLRPGDPEFRALLKKGTSNGVPMKIAAVAAYLAATGGGNKEMVMIVHDICSFSHPTDISVRAGLAHTAALLYCMSCTAEDFSPEEFINVVVEASRLGAGIFPDTTGADNITARLERIGDFRRTRCEDIVAAFRGGCYVYESLPFSYAFFIRDPHSFTAVIDVISCGGDTDSNGAFVGALQGALLGKSHLPDELLIQVQRRDIMQTACDRFAREFL